MIASHARDIVHLGQPATLRVIRNDGFCWGRIVVTATREQLDVNATRDQYEEHDTEALDYFEEAAKSPRHVTPAHGWLDSA